MDWKIIRHLGHKEMLEGWAKKLPRGYDTIQLLTVGGADVTKTTTNPNGSILWLYSGG